MFLRKVIQSIPIRNVGNTSLFIKNNNFAGLRFGSGVSKSIDRHGTTILVVRKDGKTVMAGDGQVSAGKKYVLTSSKLIV